MNEKDFVYQYRGDTDDFDDEISLRRINENVINVDSIVLRSSTQGGTRTSLIISPQITRKTGETSQGPALKIIYEKRGKDRMFPTQRLSPGKIRQGEWIEIPIDKEGTEKLFERLCVLFGLSQQEMIQKGKTRYRRVGDIAIEIDRALKGDANAQRLLSSVEGMNAFGKLLGLISQNEGAVEILETIKRLDDEKIEALGNAASIARLDRAIATIEKCMENQQEERWQRFFTKNHWIIESLFSSPFTLIADKAYVGGTSVDKNGANFCDYLLQNKLSGNVCLIEIKTPSTSIIGRPYRSSSFSISSELSGAINQVLAYRDSFLVHYSDLKIGSEALASAISASPKCVVIAGRIGALTTTQKHSFENFRSNLTGVEIIAYDELLSRLVALRSILTFQKTNG